MTSFELSAVAYMFPKIFQPGQTDFNCSFGDPELLSFICFPSVATAETKKKTLSAVEDFNSFLSHSGTQQLIGREKQKQTR